MRRKQKLSATDRVLIEMLTENTGRALCDSGDAYGRNWQRNQGRDFLAEPATTLRVREYNGKPEIEITHNVFYWLRDRLDYDAKMNARFSRFAKKHPDETWFALVDLFTEDKSDAQTVNTYNGEDLLSQTLQYTTWKDEEINEEYVLLSIHGGADVRGGYTRPRAFRVMEEYALCDNAKAELWEAIQEDKRQAVLPSISAERDPAYWYTDDGCYWYRNGACGLNAGKQLEKYDVSHDPADKGKGKIYIADDGKAYGPVYGGELQAGFV